MLASDPLTPADIRRIRAAAATADDTAALQPSQLAVLHSRGWFRLLAPRASGGAELPLPEVVRLEERLARIDGSTAWVATLCAGAGWFAGFLPPALARQVIATRRLCLTGSGAPTGVAQRDGAGWRLNGRWAHASGAVLATHFTMNAVLQRDGQALRHDDGSPRIQAFLVPAAQVRVLPTWSAIGLRASGSHAFAVEDAWAPHDHGFTIAPSAATCDGPLYRFPFLALAYVTLAANVCGLALQFLDLAAALLQTRPRRDAVELQARLAAGLDDARQDFFFVLEAAWRRNLESLPVDEGALASTSLALVESARDAVDRLYPWCGLQAARPGTAIHRAWRDLHTATQHALLLPPDAPAP